jgi:putative endonuclease
LLTLKSERVLEHAQQRKHDDQAERNAQQPQQDRHIRPPLTSSGAAITPDAKGGSDIFAVASRQPRWKKPIPLHWRPVRDAVPQARSRVFTALDAASQNRDPQLPKRTMSCFVYILASGRNGTLYTGVTSDPARRIAEHKSGAVPGFTRAYGVKRLVYIEKHASVLDARAREHSLKRWRRAWKIKLIESMNPNWDDLSDKL